MCLFLERGDERLLFGGFRCRLLRLLLMLRKALLESQNLFDR